MNLSKDKLYQLLFKEYNGKPLPNYSQLGRESGLTRQTVSKRIKDYENKELLTYDNNNCIQIKDIFEIDFQDGIKHFNFNDEEDLNKSAIIYAIIEDGIVKYVGQTENYENRKLQHMKKREWLKENNFIILTKTSIQNKSLYERMFIKAIQPEWNVMCNKKGNF